MIFVTEKSFWLGSEVKRLYLNSSVSAHPLRPTHRPGEPEARSLSLSRLSPFATLRPSTATFGGGRPVAERDRPKRFFLGRSVWSMRVHKLDRVLFCCTSF